MVEVWSKAPLRVGLAGGGTDLSHYSTLFGGEVVNATIGFYVHTRISPSKSEQVEIISHDNGISESHAPGTLEFRDAPLFSASYNHICSLVGEFPAIRIESFSDSPVGSGLGTSSTLCVTLISALSKYMGIEFSNHEIAEKAYQIERLECGFNGGKQDQYSAVFGGFNHISFNTDNSVELESINVDEDFISELETRFVLLFTGKSRDSSAVIDEQELAALDPESNYHEYLHRIKEEAKIMRKSLADRDVDSMISSLNRSWIAKKNSSRFVSNAHIDEIIQTALESGATSAKVSGAGGGGFILFSVEFAKRLTFLEKMSEKFFDVRIVNFSSSGVKSWRRE